MKLLTAGLWGVLSDVEAGNATPLHANAALRIQLNSYTQFERQVALPLFNSLNKSLLN